MLNFSVTTFKGNLILGLNGRIDIDDCDSFDSKIKEARTMHPTGIIIFNCRELSYICGAALHTFISLNASTNIKLVNILPEVKSIFENAGVLDMFDISDFIREIKIKEENLLERYKNIRLYSVSKNTILKLYSPGTPLDFVINEQKNSHIAIQSGIPALIVYDIVKSNGCYGFLSELPEAKNICTIVKNSPVSLSRCAMMAGNLLNFVHSIDEKKVPLEVHDIKSKLKFAAGNLVKFLHPNEIKFIMDMIDVIPDYRKFIHGSFSARNIFIYENMSYLADFGSLTCGNPILDLGLIYMLNVLCAPVLSEEINSLTPEQSRQFWQVFVQAYMGNKSKTRQAQILIHASGLLMMTLYPAMHEVNQDVAEKMIALARRDLFPAGETLTQVLKAADLKAFTKEPALS